jgi:hypothetical protein
VLPPVDGCMGGACPPYCGHWLIVILIQKPGKKPAGVSSPWVVAGAAGAAGRLRVAWGGLHTSKTAYKLLGGQWRAASCAQSRWKHAISSELDRVTRLGPHCALARCCEMFACVSWLIR